MQPIDPAYIQSVLAQFGWQPAAAAWLTAHVPVVVSTDPNDDTAFSQRDQRIIVNPTELKGPPAQLAVDLEHEAHHAYDAATVYARANPQSWNSFPIQMRDPVFLKTQNDLQTLASDQQHPVAAQIAKDILNPSSSTAVPLMDSNISHYNHALIANLDFDYSQLPDWYRQTYFPYAAAGPAPVTGSRLAMWNQQGMRNPLLDRTPPNENYDPTLSTFQPGALASQGFALPPPTQFGLASGPTPMTSPVGAGFSLGP